MSIQNPAKTNDDAHLNYVLNIIEHGCTLYQIRFHAILAQL